MRCEDGLMISVSVLAPAASRFPVCAGEYRLAIADPKVLLLAGLKMALLCCTTTPGSARCDHHPGEWPGFCCQRGLLREPARFGARHCRSGPRRGRTQ